MSLAELDFDEAEMRPFRLQYKGTLHSSNSDKSRREEIHNIRRAFHEQLKRPWKSTEQLRMVSRGDFKALPLRGQKSQFSVLSERPDGRRDWQQVRMDPDWAITKRIKAGREINFVPLVIRAQKVALTCELAINIGWREKLQGGILHITPEGFDLDNRLKGLFDALSIPQGNQLPDDVSMDPTPYFLVLLEDDGFVTRTDIRTFPLGLPKTPEERDGYLEIDIEVTIHGDAIDD